MQIKITLFIIFLLSLTSQVKAQQCVYTDDTWIEGCQKIAQVHMLQQTGQVGVTIIAGLQLAAVTIEEKFGKVEPGMMFQLCQWALATAEQESFFRFAVGGAGEIGPYQFKLNTVRRVGNFYAVDLGRTDREIVETLLDDTMSTYVFTLHFYQLLMKHKTLWRAWYAYNAGKHATQYANEVTRRYKRIKQVVYAQCKQ